MHKSLGELEELILLAVKQQDGAGHGPNLRATLSNAGREIAVGTLYITLDRLEKKGFIQSQKGNFPSVSGEKSKRVYSIHIFGEKALLQAEERRTYLRNAGGGVNQIEQY